MTRSEFDTLLPWLQKLTTLINSEPLGLDEAFFNKSTALCCEFKSLFPEVSLEQAESAFVSYFSTLLNRTSFSELSTPFEDPFTPLDIEYLWSCYQHSPVILSIANFWESSFFHPPRTPLFACGLLNWFYNQNKTLSTQLQALEQENKKLTEIITEYEAQKFTLSDSWYE